MAARGRDLHLHGRRTAVEHAGKHVEIPETSRGAKFATCASLPFPLTLHRNLEEGKKKDEVV